MRTPALQRQFFTVKFGDVQRIQNKLSDPLWKFYEYYLFRLNLDSFQENAVILMLGVGQATNIILFSKKNDLNLKWIGCDLSSSALISAKLFLNRFKVKNIDLNFIACDCNHLPFQESKFNLIIEKDFLHHIQNIQSLLKKILKLLVIDGKMLILESNVLNPFMARALKDPHEIGIRNNTKEYFTKCIKKIESLEIINIYQKIILPYKNPYLAYFFKILSKTRINNLIFNLLNRFENFLSHLFIKKFFYYISINLKKKT